MILTWMSKLYRSYHVSCNHFEQVFRICSILKQNCFLFAAICSDQGVPGMRLSSACQTAHVRGQTAPNKRVFLLKMVKSIFFYFQCLASCCSLLMLLQIDENSWKDLLGCIGHIMWVVMILNKYFRIYNNLHFATKLLPFCSNLKQPRGFWNEIPF